MSVDANFWTAIAAISQVATVGVAVWAVFYTRGQVKEARETRERVAQPEVVVFVDHNKVRRYVDLVIRNFGQTTAYNIKITLPPLQVAPYKNLHDGGKVTHVYVPDAIVVLAPGQEWRTLWDSMVRREKCKETLQDQYCGFVEFNDSADGSGKQYRNPISLDIRIFWNTMWVKRTTNRSIKKALYDISDTLSGFGQDHDGLWVHTGTADAERDYQRQLTEYRQQVFERAQSELTGSLGHQDHSIDPQQRDAE